MEQNKRKHIRIPENRAIDYTVLYVETADFKRVHSAGRIIDSSPAGIGLVTDFPLEPGHVLQWNDEQSKGSLNIAMVKWAHKQNQDYRAGLLFI